MLLNQDLYTYSIQMQRYLEVQEQRINQLEQEIQHLIQEVSSIKNKPPIHIDRIEYKFDQLKVETLDGTLNIGLNPNDLNQMDEFTVNKQPITPTPFHFPKREKVVNEMANEIMSKLDEFIQETEEQVGLTVNPSYREFIKHDVSGQLEQRIIMYFDQSSPMERSSEQFEQLREKVLEKVKSDLHVALVNFITQSSDQTGGKTNGI